MWAQGSKALLVISAILNLGLLAVWLAMMVNRHWACNHSLFNTLDQNQTRDRWTPLQVDVPTLLTISFQPTKPSQDITLQANMLIPILPTAQSQEGFWRMYNYTLTPGYYSIQGDNVLVTVQGFYTLLHFPGTSSYWGFIRPVYHPAQTTIQNRGQNYYRSGTANFPVLGNVSFTHPTVLYQVALADVMSITSCRQFANFIIVVGLVWLICSGLLATALKYNYQG